MPDAASEINELLQRIAKLEAEKEAVADKNRKLWQMSEAVHNERKKIEEENAVLAAEKQKLEQEKSRLDERVKKLWQQSMSIHQEKERINQLRMVVEEQHKSVSESIDYARIIQNSILPDQNEMRQFLPGLFVLYQPRDVVSGDFYWFHPIDGQRMLLAVADCTGHGVPGAFMSMIGNTLLNQIVKENGLISPASILTELNSRIKITLKQDRAENASRDGMDIALLLLNIESKTIHFAGANRPCWMFCGPEKIFSETKGNKFAIGGIHDGDEKCFTEHLLTYESGDRLYITSDGYADQFGGEKGKKFMTGNLQSLLLQVCSLEPDLQRETLLQHHLEWRKGIPQVDDICIAGIKL